MKDRLGPKLWSDFVSHADAHYRGTYFRAFQRRTFQCVGKLGGAPCPYSFEVDLGSPNAKEKMAFIHLDHEEKVKDICAKWSDSLPIHPSRWDDGIDGGQLCHSLFGVEDDPTYGPVCIRFRCGPPSNKKGKKARYVQHRYCHDL